MSGQPPAPADASSGDGQQREHGAGHGADNDESDSEQTQVHPAVRDDGHDGDRDHGGGRGGDHGGGHGGGGQGSGGQGGGGQPGQDLQQQAEQATDAFVPVSQQRTEQLTPFGDEPTVVGAAPMSPPSGYPMPQAQFPAAGPHGGYPGAPGGYPGAPDVNAGIPDDQDATTTFTAPVTPHEHEHPTGEKVRTGIGRAMMITGAVLAALVLTYLADLLVNWGDVPRGVTVAGVDVGGLSRTSAEEKLREELQPRFDEPVTIKAGDVEAKLDPVSAGLGIDWQGTLEQAGSPPLSPISRITSLWTEHEIGIVSQSVPKRLHSAVSRLAENELNHRKVEGDIKFKATGGGVEAVPVMPRDGQQLTSIDDAISAIESGWLNQGGVTLDVEKKPVKTTEEGVRATLEQVAKPAVSAPIVMRGDGANGVLEPKVIGEAFEFTPAEDGSLTPKVDRKQLRGALEPQLASTVQEGTDAEIVFAGGQPTVKPSKVGRQIDWKTSLKPYLDVIERSENRVLPAVYKERQPKVTTQEAQNLGIKEVVGEFTTYGFAADSGVNIRQVAEEVDGAIVKPGETFSLNGYTGKRGKAEGYIEAGVIEDGVPSTAVGGGISQFATTLYNASYFAGLKDAGHQEHSYYISRYPMAREATVYQYPNGESVIDIAFTNDAPTGVAIQTEWTPSSITVKIWGTQHYRVESVTGPKRNIQKAGKQKNDDPKCEPSSGIDGFTVTNTRLLYDIDTGELVRREPRTVSYNPLPEIICTKDQR